MSGTGQAAETARSKRYEALLRVSQTLISIRSSEELFSILARELRAVVNFYVMGVGIYDERAHEMETTSYGEPGIPPPGSPIRTDLEVYCALLPGPPIPMDNGRNSVLNKRRCCLYHWSGNCRRRRSVSDRLTRFASCPEPKLHGCTEDAFLH